MADFYAALNTVIPEQYGPNAPLYPSAILFPAFTFPSWILCIAPTIWHFRQANIAAGSLILWIILNNFFNSFNAIIWPRDNFQEWWDGHIWCDIDARIQVGSYVGMTASVSMVVRKLAIVMDTRNMTVSTSRNSKVKAKIWEVVWCWVIPVLFVLLYEVVRGERYMIFGIVGCYSSHDSSWPSVVTGFMWPTIGMLFASYWACKSSQLSLLHPN
jgi:pheromone a factor receptor